jgi:hypothetical protein
VTWKFKFEKAGDRHVPSLYLMARCGRHVATVWLRKDIDNYNWHTWDERGVGGENASEPTVEQAMQQAYASVARQGFHRTARQS